MYEPSGVWVFLMDNSKLFTFDQARVKTIANTISKENARKAHLSVQDEVKMKSDSHESSKGKSKSRLTWHAGNTQVYCQGCLLFPQRLGL